MPGLSLSTRLAALAALFGYSPGEMYDSDLSKTVVGGMDLTQLLLIRGAKTLSSAVNITALNSLATVLTVPAGKAWAVLGCCGQVNVGVGIQADVQLAYADQLATPFQYGPNAAFDINIATAQSLLMQSPPSPWPYLMGPGQRIGVIMWAGTPVFPIAAAVTARVVEIDLYG